MTNESAYARNYERRQLREAERFNQVVTIFDLPMTADRRSGAEIAPGEFVEIFKVGTEVNSAVVQVRIDEGDHWLLSRQTFWLREGYLREWDPQSSEQVFQVFQRALQNEIDETRMELRRFPDAHRVAPQ